MSNKILSIYLSIFTKCFQRHDDVTEICVDKETQTEDDDDDDQLANGQTCRMTEVNEHNKIDENSVKENKIPVDNKASESKSQCNNNIKNIANCEKQIIIMKNNTNIVTL